MGTPEFAVATLDSLLQSGLNVVGVVTSPDKPSGRGRKLTRSAVKEYAEVRHLPILQPENLKNPEFIKELEGFKADVFIVVAFRMLPEAVWRIPQSGTINLHASLLPQYRGAAPINHAIINGEPVTGVTTFLIDDKIDTGNILLREEAEILPFENAGDLHDKLMKLGAGLVIRTIKGITDKTISPKPQSLFLNPGEAIRTAPKIFPGDCIINWNQDPSSIHNLIRGLAPYPCARSYFNTGDLKLLFKIFESRPEFTGHNFDPGHIISNGKDFIKIACKGGFLSIGSLQVEGKKRMKTDEFLRGFNITNCTATVS